MSRYIDAEKLKDFIFRAGPYGDDTLGYKEVLHAIDIQPIADVGEVKHGKWMPLDYLSDIEYNHFKCSLCGRHTKVFKKHKIKEDKPYCHCGAKMDLE